MINKIFTVLYNAVRFLGNPAYRSLLAVSPSLKVSASRGATLRIGKGFRTRRNTEINVRDRGTLEIGDNVFLNSGCILTAREKIVIGDNTIFGPNVVVYDNDHRITGGVVQDNAFDTAPVTIGANVWIGAGAIILKGAQVGAGCVIAAGSVVKGKIEKNTLVVQKRETTLRPYLGEDP